MNSSKCQSDGDLCGWSPAGVNPAERMGRTRWLLVFVAAIAALNLKANAGEFTSIELGFNGIGRVGNTMPVIAEASGLEPGQSVILTVAAPDPRGNLCVDQVNRAIVDAEGSVVLKGDFAVGRLDGKLRVSVRGTNSDELLADHTVTIRELTPPALLAYRTQEESLPPVAQTLQVVRQSTCGLLTIGELAGITEMETALAEMRGDQLHLVKCSVTAADRFPFTLAALDCIDVIVLEGKTRLDENQTNAVINWVSTGGHLIITSGGSVQVLLESKLGQWIQPHFRLDSETVSVRDLSSLQNIVPGAVQLSTNRRNVPMSRVMSDQVRQVAQSLDGPIIARTTIHAGIVTMVTVDLNERPLNGWRTLSRLYEMLIFDRVMDNMASSQSRNSRISSSGVSDLSTQLATAYDAVPPEQRWSSWQIMALMIGLMIIIGPLDFLIVTRVLKKPHLTWLTFPATIAAVCLFVYSQTGPDVAGLISREIHIMDLSDNVSHQLIHTRSFVSLSSSLTQRSTVGVTPRVDSVADAIPSVPQIMWHGRAEDVYGGMYRAGGAGLGRQPYSNVLIEYSPDNAINADTVNGSITNIFRSKRIERLPMMAGGSQAVSAEWLARTNALAAFESKLEVSGTGLIEGDVKFNLRLPIDDWVVFFGNRVYQPSPQATESQRTIQPGEIWNRRNEWVRASDLKSFLNGVRIIQTAKASKNVVKGDSMQVTTPYNPQSRDPLEILTMVSLFDAAGGEAYSGLRNNSLRKLELSDSIRMNAALLLGRIKDVPSEFIVDEQRLEPAQSQTIIRILLPVVRKQAAPPAEIHPVDAETANSADEIQQGGIGGTLEKSEISGSESSASAGATETSETVGPQSSTASLGNS